MIDDDVIAQLRAREAERMEAETGYLDRRTIGPCTRRSAGDEPIGRACPECGHTNVVHPNIGNPALTACALCEMEQLRRERKP